MLGNSSKQPLLLVKLMSYWYFGQVGKEIWIEKSIKILYSCFNVDKLKDLSAGLF